MIALGTEVVFREIGSGGRAEHMIGVVVGRTREEKTRYDIRVGTMICSNIPEHLVEERPNGQLL